MTTNVQYKFYILNNVTKKYKDNIHKKYLIKFYKFK